jgi:hypothetical protein
VPHESAHAKAEVLRVLRRAGIADETIAELERELSDPVDVDRDGPLLQRYGITRDSLISRLGGSP